MQLYWLWAGAAFSLLFPDDITYTIGKSNPPRTGSSRRCSFHFYCVDESAAKDPANRAFGSGGDSCGTDDPSAPWARDGPLLGR